MIGLLELLKIQRKAYCSAEQELSKEEYRRLVDIAARNRAREQNKLRMRRVREAQRAAKEA